MYDVKQKERLWETKEEEKNNCTSGWIYVNV